MGPRYLIFVSEPAQGNDSYRYGENEPPPGSYARDVAAWAVKVGDQAVPDGSLPVAKTIGTIVVAALAAHAAGVLSTITATGRRINSATRAGSRSRGQKWPACEAEVPHPRN
jgi:hypothetical protein